MSYQFLKLAHILSATLMIGTGLGSAFYLYFSYRKAAVTTVKDVLRLVIFADAIFTAPSVLIQLVTGILLSKKLGIMHTDWFWVVISVSLVVFVLWIRAAFIQVQLKGILNKENAINEKFHRLMNIWFWLGIPSFIGAVYLYYLMVYKSFI